ncbi:MAG: hypothetical protein CVV64_03135 [Candidatus Wallbacteria bacterium HGW-Wallbacteria-1]|jgi:opacity protein-like surface antigen|uniref:Outer membrane protein beta-barrel domain-containing protein n=1 Tax=Candidatus Wallbacteria bacterium HGW-Wallbacteria-1 TaxID=2013854 RepID=A0A2N1PTK3_9BACT|nr:MAG: hypothetical protein CVV64_03135 [Candidatus Wallbacteria bacterium HGW-Wallbacteria-1]
MKSLCLQNKGAIPYKWVIPLTFGALRVPVVLAGFFASLLLTVQFHIAPCIGYDLAYNTSLSILTGNYNPYTSSSINEISMDADVIVEGRLKYNFMNEYALELSTGAWRHHANYPVSHRIGAVGMPGKGSSLLYPTLLSLRYYFPEGFKKNVMTFCGAGAGWYSFRYDYTADTVVLPADRNFSVRDDTVAWHLYGGVEYFPNKEFSFSGEVRYTRGDLSADVDNDPSTAPAFIDLTGYTVSLGLTYYFREARQ